METDRHRPRRRRRSGAFALVFPAALFYDEVLFRLFTVGGVFRADILVVLGFCFVYGGVGYLVCTVSRHPRRNRRLATALLALAALPYLVEIFVFEAFKLFYDLNTVLNGADDVAASFMDQVFRLVFSPKGTLCVLLYMLPAVLYGLFGGLVGDAQPIPGRMRAAAAVRMAAFYVLCLAAIWLTPGLRRVYGEMYSFQPAVERFGVLTGLRLDIQKGLTGGGDFTGPVVMPESLAAPSQTPEPAQDAAPSQQPADYGYNQLDLPLDDPTGTADDTAKALNRYVASLVPSSKNAYTGLFQGKNLIFLSAEAFSAEAIDPVLTPTLYRLATKGIQFTDYYQPASAGTIGGEFQNIYGLLPTDGADSFKEMAAHVININMGFQLNNLGYYGKAFHNNNYKYYDRDETHVRLGYSDGYMGYGNGMEQYVTAQWPQSDYEMIAGTLPTYIDRQPFNVYYMTVSGHGTYDRLDNSMTYDHWDEVQDLPASDPVKGYIAANLELEKAMAYLVEQLEAAGIADDTVICLGADHFPYGIDDDVSLGHMPYLSELYGYEVENVFQRDHNRLILWCGALEDRDPIVVDTPTSSLDILPTLSNLFGIAFDSRLLPGRDVFSDAPALVFDLLYDWKSELGTYFAAQDRFVPAEGVDEAALPDGYVEDTTAVVRNKISFCQRLLDTDYYTYLFWR